MEQCKGHPDVRHVKCGGQISIDGEGWVDLPVGFGFANGKFVVDAARYKTYIGFCMKCEKEGTFIRIDKKPTAKRRVPRDINSKIRGQKK